MLGHCARVILAPLLLSSIAGSAFAIDADTLRIMGPQAVNFWHLEKLQQLKASMPSFQDQGSSSYGYGYDTPDKYAEFPEQWFEQPLDHFDDNNTHTFKQRYWVNKRHYKADVGGPVYVLDGGETSGEVSISRFLSSTF
jgi:hypothetical protein